MVFLILTFVFFISLIILRDWLIYKHRGRVQPDDPNDENSPVITGPGDAWAQRLADLYTKDESKRDKK